MRKQFALWVIAIGIDLLPKNTTDDDMREIAGMLAIHMQKKRE